MSSWDPSLPGTAGQSARPQGEQGEHRSRPQEGKQRPLAPPYSTVSVHKLEAVSAAPTHLGPQPHSVPRPVDKRESKGWPPGPRTCPQGVLQDLGQQPRLGSVLPSLALRKAGCLWELLARSQAQRGPVTSPRNGETGRTTNRVREEAREHKEHYAQLCSSIRAWGGAEGNGLCLRSAANSLQPHGL